MVSFTVILMVVQSFEDILVNGQNRLIESLISESLPVSSRKRLDERSAGQRYKDRDLHVLFQQSLQSCQCRQISPEDL